MSFLTSLLSPVEETEYITHTVLNSENLRQVAVKYNTTTAKLAQINHITSTAFIFPGMQIKVPKSSNINITNDSTESLPDKPIVNNMTDYLNNLSNNTQQLSLANQKRRSYSTSYMENKIDRSIDRLEQSEQSRLVKAKVVLLPDSIEGVLIVTPSAMMFEPNDQCSSNFSNITPIEEISWVECIKFPKTTTNSLKLEYEFPMVNSLLKSFSDYFEESDDFNYRFIKQSMNGNFNTNLSSTTSSYQSCTSANSTAQNYKINFEYYAISKTDITLLYNILTQSNNNKPAHLSPNPKTDLANQKSYTKYMDNIRLEHPDFTSNWFLENYETFSKLEHSYRGKLALENFETSNHVPIPSLIKTITSEIVYLPELLNSSSGHILGDSPSSSQNLKLITKNLPDCGIGISSWRLTYSTEKQGHSLASFYRSTANEKSFSIESILLIEDVNGNIFGCFQTELPHQVDRSAVKKFYGDGQSFLFKFTNDDTNKFEKFTWTGKNSFFGTGDNDHFAFGGGQGHHGIWIDSQLFKGSSQPCDTFGNESSLTDGRDFVISSLELWILE